MLLAIDIGNTHTVFGVYQGDGLRHHFRLTSDALRTVDEYRVFVVDVLLERGVSVGDISDVVIASVVPPLTAVFSELIEVCFALAPLVVEPGVKTGMPILCDNPKEVGADRVVNAVGAFEKYRGADGGPFGIIIVDFGTATTFDVVSNKGEYLGGAIAPGVVISTEALYVRASKLPRVELIIPPKAVGKDTVSSMQSGILFGYASLVDGMIQRMRCELDFDPKVIATGGVARLIAAETQSIEEIDEFLTLKGLQIIRERNM